MQWGSDLDFLTEVSLRKGEFTDSLERMPELPPEQTLIWELFATLTAARTRSLEFGKEGRQYMTPDPLVVSEIIALINAAGVVEVEQQFRIIRLIQKMDVAFLDKVKSGVK